MATTKISLDEYLSTTYHPDAEYIDGELRRGMWESWSIPGW